MEQINEMLLAALQTILVAAIGWLTQKVVKWFNEKGVTEQLHKKKYLVDIAVHAVEQIYKNEGGAQKLERARMQALDLLNANGLDISESELNSFIEDAVEEMNRALKDTINVSVESDKIREGTIDGIYLNADEVNFKDESFVPADKKEVNDNVEVDENGITSEGAK